MLHVHCGDCSAETLRRSGVADDIIVWTELLHEGPLLAGLSDDAWRTMRAQFLAGTMAGLREESCLQHLQTQDHALQQFHAYDEVVLWFDACLFDQTILIRQLDWFARQQLGKTRITLICVGEFTGMPRFRGLGDLHAEQIASLLPHRQPVTEEQYILATQAWQALLADTPTVIEAILTQDISTLPYLAGALQRQLEQFPSTFNGLNRLENACLRVLSSSRLTFTELFEQVSDLEEHPFFGDTTLWRALESMANVAQPALQLTPPQDDTSGLGAWYVSITPLGERLRDGHEDWVRMHGTDRWLGGVHLTGTRTWRWNGTQMIFT